MGNRQIKDSVISRVVQLANPIFIIWLSCSQPLELQSEGCTILVGVVGGYLLA